MSMLGLWIVVFLHLHRWIVEATEVGRDEEAD